jgi:hypothetical protein
VKSGQTAERAPLRALLTTALGPGRPPASLRSAAPSLLLFLAARSVSLAGLVLLGPGSPGYALHRLAVHWDAAWYLDIAQHGYDHAIRPISPGHPTAKTNLAFFPLYPALIRMVHTVLPGVPWGAAALLAAGGCALVAAWGIHAVTARCYGPRVAMLTTLMWGIAPVAAVETAGYSESAFTAFAAWALFAVLGRDWFLAAALSVAAGLTRPAGFAVAAAVMTAAARDVVQQRRAREDAAALARPGSRGYPAAVLAPPPVRLRGPVTAFVAAPLGWLGFIAWTGLRLHSWWAYFRIQKLWNSQFDFGFTTTREFGRLFRRSTAVSLYYPLTAMLLIGAVVLVVASVGQRQPLPLLVYSLVITAIALGDTAHWSSRARFLLPAFPLLMPVAAGLTRLRFPATRVAVLAAMSVFSLAYGTYLTLYSPGAP